MVPILYLGTSARGCGCTIYLYELKGKAQRSGIVRDPALLVATEFVFGRLDLCSGFLSPIWNRAALGFVDGDPVAATNPDFPTPQCTPRIFARDSMATAPPASTSKVTRWPSSNAMPTRVPPSASRTRTSRDAPSHRMAARKRSMLTSFPSPRAARAGPTKARASSWIVVRDKVKKPLKPVSIPASTRRT